MRARPAHLGSLGQLVIFCWAVGLVGLSSFAQSTLPVLAGVIVLGFLHPHSLRRFSRPRWLALLLLLVLLNLFFGPGEPELVFRGLALSCANLLAGLQMALSAAAILLAADGLSAAVDVTELAGLLERAGLRGLGFSIGVAFNLLPTLRRSGAEVWYSLRMRGGLRRRWLRGLQLLLVTVLANALRHSEEILLAAETRAFDPGKSRSLPIRIGRLDAWLIPAALLSLAGIALLPWW